MTLDTTNRLERSAHWIDYVSYGVPFRVRVDSEEVRSVLPSLLPHASEIVEAPSPGAQEFALLSTADGYRFHSGASVACANDDLSVVTEQFTRELMIHVANHAPEYVFLHAGVVGVKGSALVLPGRSMIGKSTLVAALIRQGATYYSDEYAVVDCDGFIHPYARSLQMREPGGTEQRGVSADKFGAETGATPLRAKRVVFASYAKDSMWALEPVSSGMAVLEMLRHSIPVQRTPARVMATLHSMMMTASAWRTERGDAEQAAEILLDLMST